MDNSKSSIDNPPQVGKNRKSPRSWHHRMARLSFDGDWRPKCMARNCSIAGTFACEYDFMRLGRPVVGTKVLCKDHAERFAAKHRIDINVAPVARFSQLEFADRDGWAYGEDALC